MVLQYLFKKKEEPEKAQGHARAERVLTTSSRVTALENDLLHSFSKVKKDVQALHEWVQYLHKKTSEHERHLHSLHSEVSQIPHAHKQLKEYVDYHHFYNIQKRIDELQRQIAALKTQHSVTYPQVTHLPTTPTEAKPSLKDKLLRTFRRKSKSYIKSVILAYLEQHKRLSALDIKEIVVDQQTLCSKSSFYRILDELEDEEKLNLVRDGKLKVYFAKGIRH